MKILISSLLLFIGLNQALARSSIWKNFNRDEYDHGVDNVYDLLNLPRYHSNDDLFRFMMDEEWERPAKSEKQNDNLGGFLNTLLDTSLDADEEHTNSNESTQNQSAEEKENGNDDDDDDGEKKLWNISNTLFTADDDDDEKDASVTENDESKEKKVNSDEKTSVLEVDIFGLTKSSEERQDSNEMEAQSSEEVFNTKDTTEGISNEATEIADMTKSSEEQNTDNLSDEDLNEIVSFFIALDVLSDMVPLLQTAETKDDMARGQEVDGILELLGSVLGELTAEELSSKRINNNEKADDKSVENVLNSNESVETEDSNESATTQSTTTTTTTQTSDSNENSDENGSQSNSSEHDSNLVYVVFKGFGEEDGQQNLDEHKYSVINSQDKQDFKPTLAPRIPEKNSASLSPTNAQDSIKEYVIIREDLDTQQESLKKHELDLDKDFYAIVSNSLDNNTLNRFESDINAAQDQLDRIKKNINAMQNLKTKLYFHKLVTSAVKEAHSNLNN